MIAVDGTINVRTGERKVFIVGLSLFYADTLRLSIENIDSHYVQGSWNSFGEIGAESRKLLTVLIETKIIAISPRHSREASERESSSRHGQFWIPDRNIGDDGLQHVQTIMQS